MNEYVKVVSITPLLPKVCQWAEKDLSLDGALARMVDAQNMVELFQGLQIHVSYRMVSSHISNFLNK